MGGTIKGAVTMTANWHTVFTSSVQLTLCSLT